MLAARERLRLAGEIHLAVFDARGRLRDQRRVPNLITQAGARIYGRRMSGAGTDLPPTGMQLGTDATAAAYTGTGAAIIGYVSGGKAAFQFGYPAEAAQGDGTRVTYLALFPAGVGTHGALREIVIVNQPITTDSGAPAANTICRAVYSSLAKAADEALVATWTHDAEG